MLTGLLTKDPQKRLAWPHLEHHPFLVEHGNIHSILFRPGTAGAARPRTGGTANERAPDSTAPVVATESSHSVTTAPSASDRPRTQEAPGSRAGSAAAADAKANRPEVPQGTPSTAWASPSGATASPGHPGARLGGATGIPAPASAQGTGRQTARERRRQERAEEQQKRQQQQQQQQATAAAAPNATPAAVAAAQAGVRVRREVALGDTGGRPAADSQQARIDSVAAEAEESSQSRRREQVEPAAVSEPASPSVSGSEQLSRLGSTYRLEEMVQSQSTATERDVRTAATDPTTPTPATTVTRAWPSTAEQPVSAMPTPGDRSLPHEPDILVVVPPDGTGSPSVLDSVRSSSRRTPSAGRSQATGVNQSQATSVSHSQSQAAVVSQSQGTAVSQSQATAVSQQSRLSTTAQRLADGTAEQDSRSVAAVILTALQQLEAQLSSGEDAAAARLLAEVHEVVPHVDSPKAAADLVEALTPIVLALFARNPRSGEAGDGEDDALQEELALEAALDLAAVALPQAQAGQRVLRRVALARGLPSALVLRLSRAGAPLSDHLLLLAVHLLALLVHASLDLPLPGVDHDICAAVDDVRHATANALCSTPVVLPHLARQLRHRHNHQALQVL